MTPKTLLRASFAATVAFATVGQARAAEPTAPFVRLAEIEIDPSRMEAFIAAANEEIRASVQLEPGVLALYAVTLKDDPAHVRVFEMYRDAGSYASHLQAPHFLKFKAVTQDMVRSLKLHDTNPIAIAAKPGS